MPAKLKDKETGDGLEYIRQYYGVPAELGRRVRYAPPGHAPQIGTIVGTSGSYLRVSYETFPGTALHHPTWCLSYLTDAECSL